MRFARYNRSGCKYFKLTFAGSYRNETCLWVTGKLVKAVEASIGNVSRIKQSTDLPVAVGFGVRTPEQAAEIAKVADGVVVGSALVELVGKFGKDAPEQLKELTSALALAIQTAR